MPVVTRSFMPMNGTRLGDAFLTPPGSYIEPIEGEATWWKYSTTAILLVVGVGGFGIILYECMGIRRRRAARDAPAVGHPPNAPVGVGSDTELVTIDRDPPYPHDVPDDAAEVQQGRYEPNVVLENPEGMDPDIVGHGDADPAGGDAGGGAPVDPDMAVAGGGA